MATRGSKGAVRTRPGRKKKKTTTTRTRRAATENPSETPTEVSTDRIYWARRPFKYAGEQLDRGQIVELAGAINDEKLVRLGFFAPLTDDRNKSECGRCGAWFVDMSLRDGHVRTQHTPRRGPVMKDLEHLSDGEMRELVDRLDAYDVDVPTLGENVDPEEHEHTVQERSLDEVAPLYLDKTEASRS